VDLYSEDGSVVQWWWRLLKLVHEVLVDGLLN
jgi:hypothetical protein